MSANRSAIAVTSVYSRTKIANNSKILAGVDGRSAGARRYREILANLTSSVLRNHLPPITEAEMSLLRRAATLSIICEGLDAALARGEPVDPLAYSTAANALRRIVTDLGLKQSQS